MKSYISYDLSRKRFMEQNYKNKNRKQAENTQGYYLREERYVGHGDYIELSKPYVKRFRRNRYKTAMKRYCNRSVRHKMSLSSYNNYRKAKEYKWLID